MSYGEPLNEARTLLAGFVNSLLASTMELNDQHGKECS